MDNHLDEFIMNIPTEKFKASSPEIERLLLLDCQRIMMKYLHKMKRNETTMKYLTEAGFKIQGMDVKPTAEDTK